MLFQFSLDEIKNFARRFWEEAGDARVFAFHGPMGAGKTTFIHALCEVKGVSDTVGSPTFSIVNEYAYMENGVARKIYHLDLYRLNGEDEAIRAGVEDCLFSDDICLVEWPEKAPGIFPADTRHVYITVTGAMNRKLGIADK